MSNNASRLELLSKIRKKLDETVVLRHHFPHKISASKSCTLASELVKMACQLMDGKTES